MAFNDETTGPLVEIGPRASARDAVATMAMINRGALPVMENGKLLGVIAFGDLSRRACMDGSRIWSRPVADLMTTKVAILEEDGQEFSPENPARQDVTYLLVVDASNRPKDLVFVNGRTLEAEEDGGMEDPNEPAPRPTSEEIFDELLKLARTYRRP